MINAAAQINQRYQLQAKLGEGGMGVVYRAYDRFKNEVVALKQVNVAPSALSMSISDTDGALALAQEFRTLAGLRHPHIVAVLDYGFDTRRFPYYTMQLLEQAKPLTEYAEYLSEGDKLRCLIDMLQALVYLHRRDIIHRDLKPGNILVTPPGEVKVVDFGLALHPNLSAQSADDDNFAGTLAYMAPELFAGKSASVASDLYAVGVIIYEMFAGKHPFSGENLMQYIKSIRLHEIDLTPLPPTLRPVVERLLAKDPDSRYVSAQHLINELYSATDSAIPPESPLLRESFLQASAFVGREAEFARLNHALQETLHGQGSVWLIGGESGVGKSRLLDEIRTHALVKGALVLRGQAVAEGGLPYHLWRNAVRRLLLHTPVTDLEAAVLKAIVPDISALLERDIPDAPELKGAAGQQRLILTLVDLFRRQPQPVVLLLEDLHWSEESLAPIRQMLAVRDSLPYLLLIATYLDEERPELPDELAGAHLLKLTRLNQTAIAHLTAAMLGEIGKQAAVVDLLLRETEGNIFFIVETVRALAEEAGTMAAIGRNTLPNSVFAGGVRHLIQRRLNHVSAAFHPLLRCAAIAGRSLDLAVLRAMSGVSDLDDFLVISANAGVLEVAEGGWRFSHDKLREGVLLDLPESEAQGLHRQAAQAIETVYPGDHAYHEMLLEHWRAAGDSARELDYLIPVMRHLMYGLAEHERAQQLAVRGLSLLAEDDARLSTLLNMSSKNSWSMGNFALAQEQATRALALARSRDDRMCAAESLNNLGAIAGQQGDYPGAAAHFEQSLALYRELGDKPGIAYSLNGLGLIAQRQGEFDAALQYYYESLALRREIDDKFGIAISLNNLGVIAEGRDSQAARNYYQGGLTLSREIGDKEGIAYGLLNLGAMAHREGDHLAAGEYYRQSLEMFHTIGEKYGVAVSLNGMGIVAQAQGNDEAAAMHLQQSLELSREIGDKRGTGVNLNSLCSLALDRREYTQAAEYAGQAHALFTEIGDQMGVVHSVFYIGVVAQRQGKTAEAQAYFEQSIALSHKLGDQNTLAETLAEVSRLQFESGLPETPATLREALRLALEAQVTPLVLEIFTWLARVWLGAGDLAQAAALAGLVEYHPATRISTRRDNLETLKRELAAVIPASEKTLELARGAKIDITVIAKRLLDKPLPTFIPRPAAPMPDTTTAAQAVQAIFHTLQPNREDTQRFIRITPLEGDETQNLREIIDQPDKREE